MGGDREEGEEEEEEKQQKEEEEGPAGVSLHLPASRLSTGQEETSTRQLHRELFSI